ncbi:MAG: hypothetical protein ABSG83_08520 [Roseiarcus sp.]
MTSGPIPGNGVATGVLGSGPYDAQLMSSFLNLIQSGTSPDAVEAQNIILRRIALQGDVVASRVPPPLNISEIGGYINLLTTLNQTDMLAQTLAGVLGVAGPVPTLGWVSNSVSLGLAQVPNDRPAVAAQASIPITIAIRTDFLPAFQAAMTTLHNQGATLPLLSGPIALPTAQPGLLPTAIDPMPYLGRALDVVPGTALVNPSTDAIALVSSTGPAGPYQLAAQVLSPGTVAVAGANWTALQCTATACTPVALSNAQFVPIAPLLATVGFYPANPLPIPTSLTSLGWGHFTNVTGLVAGQTALGDELANIYTWSQIVQSAFAGALNWLWNGSTFAASAGS